MSISIDCRINYRYRNDINIDIEYVDTFAIEIPKEELNTIIQTITRLSYVSIDVLVSNKYLYGQINRSPELSHTGK